MKIKIIHSENNCSETFWAEYLTSTTAKVDNIPIYLKSINLDDVIEFRTNTDNSNSYVRTSVFSGNSKLVIEFKSDLFKIKQTLISRIIRKLGCSFEGYTHGTLVRVAISIPKNIDTEYVRSKITQYNWVKVV